MWSEPARIILAYLDTHAKKLAKKLERKGNRRCSGRRITDFDSQKSKPVNSMAKHAGDFGRRFRDASDLVPCFQGAPTVKLLDGPAKPTFLELWTDGRSGRYCSNRQSISIPLATFWSQVLVFCES